ncbi:hypothetical protein C0993_008082 [Termitomyces sp. T159_Od127]|nr:hypothetical protein C0993_008082 [Termitomyces sp. T159_Od127]
MSISLVSNAYLDEASSKIRSKPVPWEGYQRADLITSEELVLIKKVDKQPKAKVEQTLFSDLQTYAFLYFRLLKKLQRVDTMQCLLVLIADALSGLSMSLVGYMMPHIQHQTMRKESQSSSGLRKLIRISLFCLFSEPSIPRMNLYNSKLLKSSRYSTAGIVAFYFFCRDPNTINSPASTPLPVQYLKPFLDTLASLVQGSAPNKRDVAVQCLESLLSRRDCRQAIWSVPGIIAGYIDILKQRPGPQMTYQVALCFWLLSFEQNVAEELDKKYDVIPLLIDVAQGAVKEKVIRVALCFWLLSFEQNVAEELDKKYDVIPLLIDVAQGAVKEKVIRVVVATFRNLVTKAPAANLPAMLAAKLLPFVKNLYARKWQDEDILEDIEYLRDELNTNFQSLTTYDEYTSELSSGYLSWSPVHESDEFWKENASKLNDDDCKQLQILLRLLNDSTDPLVLAVAVQDIGQYVKHTDRGKKLVEKYNGKARVMELMTHEDSEVRYRALVAVQQLVSQPWTAV